MSIGPDVGVKPTSFKQNLVKTLGYVHLFPLQNAKLLLDEVRPVVFVNKGYYPELDRDLKKLEKAANLLDKLADRKFLRGKHAKAAEMYGLKAEAHNLRAQLFERIGNFNFASEEYEKEGWARDWEATSRRRAGDQKGAKEAMEKSKKAFENAKKARAKAEEQEKSEAWNLPPRA